MNLYSNPKPNENFHVKTATAVNMTISLTQPLLYQANFQCMQKDTT